MRKALVVLFACAALAQDKPEKSEKSEFAVEVNQWMEALAVSRADLKEDTPRAQEEFEVKCKQAVMAQYKLMDLLAQHEELWPDVRRRLHRLLSGGDERADVRARVYTILATDKDEHSREIVRAEVEKRPGTFPPRTLIELDESGMKGARAALITIVKNGADPYLQLVEPAAHLALRGIDVGKDVLERASKDERFTKYTGPLQYTVAIALERMGDDTAWKRTTGAVREQIGKLLEKSKFQTARYYALNLEYFTKLARGNETIHVLTVNHESYDYVRAREKDIDSPADLHELLVELAKAT